MQPSQSEIQREFEALRDIRRRTSAQGGPGALILDPDLPSQPSTSSSTLSSQPGYWSSTSPSNNDSGSTEGSSDSSHSSGGPVVDDPLHLFWVPAHLHPEIAPSEFRAFLKEHARSPPDGSTPALSRSSSSSSRLGRKSSMLSRQYKPRENDGVEDEDHVVPIQRRKSAIYANSGPQLSINDLQKLEELAEEAANSDDPSKLRNVLRRSLSLNVPPSFLGQENILDDADAPIIVPLPNQILRRAARTKIRKPGLSGDGGGHRFPASRRRPDRDRAYTVDSVVSDVSSSELGSEEHKQTPAFSIEEDEESSQKRNTYTEESFIYDSYAVDETEEKGIVTETTSPPKVSIMEEPLFAHSVPVIEDTKTFVEEPLEHDIPHTAAPVLHHPQPQRQLSVPQTPVLSRTPSPEAPSISHIPEEFQQLETSSPEPPSFLSTSPSPDKRKKEEKKGLLGKWGGDKKSKKGGKDDKREKEKEKDSGFFGSLFGGSKKKQEDQGSTNFSHGTTGPATAAALLGASKSSKVYQQPPSPQLANMYARYPIHVERAVYRLSHIKLANPRRPLYEQVLISNLMFWYLGVINKTQQGPTQAQTQTQSQTQNQPTQQPNASGVTNTQTAESPFQHPNNNIENELTRPEYHHEIGKQEPLERIENGNERERARRPSLTKSPPTGAPTPVGRRAETPPSKGTQLIQQPQVAEQEFVAGGTPTNVANVTTAPIVRTASAPPQSTSLPPTYNNVNTYNHPQSLATKQANLGSGQAPFSSYSPQHIPQYYGISGHPDGQVPRYMQQHLPQGAIQPQKPVEWLGHSAAPHNPHKTSIPQTQIPSAHTHDPNSQQHHHHSRPPRSVPPNHYHLSDGVTPTGKAPARSLSANAIAPDNQHERGAMLKKKPPSASAVAPGRHHGSEQFVNNDEDVPLAVWQQQRRR